MYISRFLSQRIKVCNLDKNNKNGQRKSLEKEFRNDTSFSVASPLSS